MSDVSEIGLFGRPTRLHHLGWAVPDLASGGGVFAALLGLPHLLDEQLPGTDLRFFEAGECLVELLSARGDNEALREILARQGGGLHHLAFAVDDVNAALGAAGRGGCALIDEVKRPGSRGTEIGFVDPAWPGGVLLEFVADPALRPSAR
jgi:methylmalonyl-CoA/ethylmalonyl-CoA epimerase